MCCSQSSHMTFQKNIYNKSEVKQILKQPLLGALKIAINIIFGNLSSTGFILFKSSLF
jgi:hypothetical protein